MTIETSKIDRRSILKAAVTAAAAATIPAVAAKEVVAGQAITAELCVTAPPKLKPYTNYIWEWFVSNDGEVYYEAFPTKEEAIKYAQQCDYAFVAECIQQDFRLDVDGYRIIEDLNDSNMDLIGEAEGIEATLEQERDLERMVKRAIEAWVVKHGINITAWSFDGVKDKTLVPEKVAAEK